MKYHCMYMCAAAFIECHWCARSKLGNPISMNDNAPQKPVDKYACLSFAVVVSGFRKTEHGMPAKCQQIQSCARPWHAQFDDKVQLKMAQDHACSTGMARRNQRSQPRITRMEIKSNEMDEIHMEWTIEFFLNEPKTQKEKENILSARCFCCDFVRSPCLSLSVTISAHFLLHKMRRKYICICCSTSIHTEVYARIERNMQIRASSILFCCLSFASAMWIYCAWIWQHERNASRNTFGCFLFRFAFRISSELRALVS